MVIPVAYQGDGENAATLELEHSSLQAANSSTETFTEEPFQVLIFSEGSEGEKEPKSSTMMLAQFDPSDGETRIVSLLSDSYVSIPGHQDDTLDAVYHLGGTDLLGETLVDNFDLSVDYFAKINEQGFLEILDIIAPEGIYLPNKTAGFNSEELLHYIREENGQTGKKTARQMDLIEILHSHMSEHMTVADAPTIISTLTTNVQTNVPTGTLLEWGKEYFTLKNPTIETMTIPVAGSYDNTWRDDEQNNRLTFDKEPNRQAIEEFLDSNDDEF
ncbi:hypothetical protein JCM19037_4300 [Geomicrobium sp. JCM 19037]|nr:hypothetical protein JCM19037_4300 [Geomicrobium sp. JCM 19037]